MEVDYPQTHPQHQQNERYRTRYSDASWARAGTWSEQAHKPSYSKRAPTSPRESRRKRSASSSSTLTQTHWQPLSSRNGHISVPHHQPFTERSARRLDQSDRPSWHNGSSRQRSRRVRFAQEPQFKQRSHTRTVSESERAGSERGKDGDRQDDGSTTESNHQSRSIRSFHGVRTSNAEFVSDLLRLLNDAVGPPLDDGDLREIFLRIAGSPQHATYHSIQRDCGALGLAILARKQELASRNNSSITDRMWPISPRTSRQQDLHHLPFIRGSVSSVNPISPTVQSHSTPTTSNILRPHNTVGAFLEMPTVDQFLTEISSFLRSRNGRQIQNYLPIEPEFKPLYNVMIQELRQRYPKGSGSEDKLEDKVNSMLPEARDGYSGDATWTAFIKFMTQYLAYLRDLNIENLLDTYNLLSELVHKCNSALSHTSWGILILPTVVTYSKVLARLALALDKRPDLLAKFRPATNSTSDARETLPEKAANTIRQAFVTCLNDRSGSPTGLDTSNQPEAKKTGIYKLANLCLRILFRCGKAHNAEQIFVNVYNQSPPLAAYPRSERVTYLYFLGRFLLDNQHFFRAQLALQQAYAECHAASTTQRRLLLIPLISCNIILGRFPSHNLYTLPEATGLQPIFHPLCVAISKGDLRAFQALLSPSSPVSEFLWRHGVLYALQSRALVALWRSLVRKTFLLTGDAGDAVSKKAPTLAIRDVATLLRFLDDEARVPEVCEDQRDPSGFQNEDTEDEDERERLSVMDAESVVSALINQGLVNGYLSHRQPVRLAIQGAKARGAVAAGFPRVWEVLSARGDTEVPGWRTLPLGAQAGMVVNLGGARGGVSPFG